MRFAQNALIIYRESVKQKRKLPDMTQKFLKDVMPYLDFKKEVYEKILLLSKREEICGNC